MQVTSTHKNIENHRLELCIEVPYNELENEFNSLLKKYSGTLSLPGFRKGRVPPKLIKNKFGEDVKAETLNKIIPKAIDTAIKENELKTYGPPEFSESEEKLEYLEGKPLQFKVNCNLPPECIIPEKLKGLEMTATKINVTEEDQANALRDRLFQFAESKEIEDGWELKDLLRVDLTFLSADETVLAQNLANMAFSYRETEEKDGSTLGVGANPPYLNQIFSEVKGMKTGDEKEITHKFSQDTEVEALQNQEFKIKLKLVQVTRMVVPELTSEMFEKLGVKSEDELKSQLDEQLEKYVTDRENMLNQEKALEALVPKVEFKIPDIAVEYYLHEQWNQMIQQMMGGQPIQDDRFKTPSQPWMDENRERSKKEIEKQLIIEAVKKKQKIEVGEDEVNQEVGKMAKLSGQELKEYRRELIKSGQFTHMKNRLIVEKAIKWVMDQVKVKKTEETTFSRIQQSNQPA